MSHTLGVTNQDHGKSMDEQFQKLLPGAGQLTVSGMASSNEAMARETTIAGRYLTVMKIQDGNIRETADGG